MPVHGGSQTGLVLPFCTSTDTRVTVISALGTMVAAVLGVVMAPKLSEKPRFPARKAEKKSCSLVPCGPCWFCCAQTVPQISEPTTVRFKSLARGISTRHNLFIEFPPYPEPATGSGIDLP